MDAKLRSILSLALHPQTGEGEAAAALNRARAMVAKQSFEALMGKVETTTEVRERVVYRPHTHTHALSLTCTIPPRWQLSFVERMFKDAPSYNCAVEMISCCNSNDKSQRMELKVRITGTQASIARFESEIDRWYDVMNGKAPNTGSEKVKSTKKSRPWWKKLADLV